MGLGAFGGGLGVTRWLCQQGADVTVTDLRPEQDLTDAIASLGSTDCRFVLGQHQHDDFAQTDLVVVNPAVPHPWDNPYLQTALDAGATLTTEIRLLVTHLDRTRCIGITGTAGKSTTAAMTHHLLTHTGQHTVLGGNIGGSLLCDLKHITPDTWVVLELSSAQLHWLSADAQGWPGWSPGIAAITNISKNHLDWHGSMAHYTQSKDTIFRYQKSGEVVLRGAHLPTPTLPLTVPGVHNQRNAALALAITEQAIDRTPDAAAWHTFRGLPHRLSAIDAGPQPRFFNDSKSTTPEATLQAVHAFDCPDRIHLIAGGYDKGVPLDAIAALAPSLAGCYLIGQTAPALAALQPEHTKDCGTLETAVRQAYQRMRPDDILLLSPGCASWDQFADYRIRGDHFTTLVRALTP